MHEKDFEKVKFSLMFFAYSLIIFYCSLTFSLSPPLSFGVNRTLDEIYTCLAIQADESIWTGTRVSRLSLHHIARIPVGACSTSRASLRGAEIHIYVRRDIKLSLLVKK